MAAVELMPSEPVSEYSSMTSQLPELCRCSNLPPSFVISSDDSSLDSQTSGLVFEQSSLNSPSTESQSSSSSYSSTEDSANESSDLDTKTWLNLLDAPPGPFSVLELTEDDDVLCFDEKLNRIVRINAQTGERAVFTVSKKFEIEHFYWSHIVAISSDILLALLKKHSTKHFYLASFGLKPESQSADEITVLNTKISCEGFQTTCQKINDNCYFGFFNTVKRYNKIKARKSDSDVELLERQFSEKESTRLSLDSQEEAADAKVDDDLLNPDIQNSTKIDKQFIRKTGSVIIKAHCDIKGQINFHVVSIGKKRLDLHVVLPKYGLTAMFTKSSKYGLQPKYMTTLPITPSLKGPFYHNGLTYFIDRENPLKGYVSKTFLDPKQDIISTIKSKLMPSSIEKKRLEEIIISCSPDDGAPDPESIWSSFSFQVEAKDGLLGYICIQGKDQICSLWKLEIESRTITSSSSAPGISNGVREKPPAHLTDGHRPGSPVRVHSTLSSPPSYASASSGHGEAHRIPVLKWSRSKCPEFGKTFRLCENVALKVSKNCGFVRGIRTDPAEKENGYCVAKFQLPDCQILN